MKKVFIMAIAVAAMTLTSCNNSKTNAPKADAEAAMTDSAANQSTAAAEAPANADQLVEQLNEKVKAKDGKGLSELLTNAQTKMAELAQKNPQEAQEYITKLQQWMLDNSENLQAALKASGNEAAAEAIGAAIGAASKADAKAITEGMAKAQEAAKSVTPEQMEAAKKAAQEAAAKMQGKGGEAAQ
ncbi:MAG: biopolymer transporter [Prevotella fusca]|uniref:biopolymer transporter n=1 Tax=Prevotella fusca TaxID=589436 RepID=UPI003F9F02A9